MHFINVALDNGLFLNHNNGITSTFADVVSYTNKFKYNLDEVSNFMSQRLIMKC